MTEPFHAASAGAQHIVLRASACLRTACALFVAAAGAAVYACAAPLVGSGGAAALAGLIAALVALRARAARERCQPAALQIDAGAGVLAAFDRDGRLLARGQIAGCTQWSDLLVVLTVQGRGRRATPLVIPADAVDAPVFRALCVLGRRAARGTLAAA
ncbi:protein YgfX [Burkholderia sp. MSMB1589WGS]|uniref:protein YgfX n=1 Tax=Burkholderia sp. MSMB1589WGS TaxID=1636425 RepID=UPI0007B9D88D|nr:protein YgfX [Burkholderia sp. MSMB1589WGS]